MDVMRPMAITSRLGMTSKGRYNDNKFIYHMMFSYNA